MIIDFGDILFLNQLKTWLKEHDLEVISIYDINERIAELRKKYDKKAQD